MIFWLFWCFQLIFKKLKDKTFWFVWYVIFLQRFNIWNISTKLFLIYFLLYHHTIFFFNWVHPIFLISWFFEVFLFLICSYRIHGLYIIKIIGFKLQLKIIYKKRSISESSRILNRIPIKITLFENFMEY